MINPAIEQRSRQRLDIIAGDLARADDLGPDLAAGAAGVALFFAYRYQASGDDADGDAALKFLERALTSATAEAEAGLFRKRLGVAWVLAHLADSLVDLGDHDPNDAMDAAVLKVLDGPLPFYDLMSGLAGIGIYALERLPRPAAVAILERVVDELGRRAQRDGDGITWFTPPELLPPVYRARAPHGCFRLGLAQGIPGVVGLLGHMRSAGVCIEAVDELLEHAVAWLRSRARPPGSPYWYDEWITPDGTTEPPLGAWAGGDPGVAVVFHAAGDTDFAVEVARAVAGRLPAESGISRGDVGLGAAGICHTLRRLHEATGDELLGIGAERWLAATLDLPVPERGFFEGSAGVGLVLLATVSDVTPTWDRILLLPGKRQPGS
jgi:hypothetical protein